MRRRQALSESPVVVQTEFEHINQSKLPEEAPRRRHVFSANPVIEKPKEKMISYQDHLKILQETVNTFKDKAESRKRGRPPKNNQSP